MEPRIANDKSNYGNPYGASESGPGRDPQLWELAKRRASFKGHLTTYLVMSVFFWAIWYLTGGPGYSRTGIPWPVWPMFGWGIGVLFHYLGAYVFPKSNLVAQEYEKLVNEKNKQ